MDYSVYIIQDRNKTNAAILRGLTGDTGFRENLKNVGADAVNDLVGGGILDQYATTAKLGENGIAINGEMINSVSIKPALIKKETLDVGTTQVAWLLKTTITVKGNLFAPALVEIKSQAVKNKNMARVLAWATLPKTYPSWEGEDYNGPVTINDNEGIVLNSEIRIGYVNDAAINTANSYDSQYYRRVLVTVYSDSNTQFRATLYDRVYVSSYEEEYSDKDGNGKFTLVMECVGTNIFDAFIAGPTFKFSKLALAEQVSSTAKQYTKKTKKVVETIDKVAGTDISDKMEPYMKKTENVGQTTESLSKDWKLDNLADNTEQQAETWHPTDMEDAINQASEYQQAYGGLSDDQKDTLKNIPGFDKLSTKEKLEYIEKLKDKND